MVLEFFEEKDEKKARKLLWRHRNLQVRLFKELSKIPSWRKKKKEECLKLSRRRKGLKNSPYLDLSSPKDFQNLLERAERVEKLLGRKAGEVYLARKMQQPLKEVKKELKPFREKLEQGDLETLSGLIGLSGSESERVLKTVFSLIDEMVRVRNEIYRFYGFLALKVVKKHLSSYSEDAFQTTYEGFVKAVELYRPYRGVRFSTYLYYWFRQAIRRFVENQVFLVRIPAHRIREERQEYLSLSFAPNGYELEKFLSGVPDPEEELLEREERLERIKRGRLLMSYLKVHLSDRKFKSLMNALEEENYEKVREIVFSEFAVDIIREEVTKREEKCESSLPLFSF